MGSWSIHSLLIQVPGNQIKLMRTALTIRETKLRRRFCGVASAVAQHDVEQTFVETADILRNSRQIYCLINFGLQVPHFVKFEAKKKQFFELS